MIYGHFLYGGSDFAIKTGRSGTPRAENSIFSKAARNELKTGAFHTEFYGEFESEVGFAINPQKSSKNFEFAPHWFAPHVGSPEQSTLIAMFRDFFEN